MLEKDQRSQREIPRITKKNLKPITIATDENPIQHIILGYTMITNKTKKAKINIIKALAYFFTLTTPNILFSENKKSFEVGILDCALAYSQNSNSNLRFDAQVSAEKYEIKQHFSLNITTKDSIYITILDHGSDPTTPKRSYQLAANIPIARDHTYHFPPPNSTPLEISPPIGINWLEVIASKTPLHNPEVKSKNIAITKEKDTQKDIETSNCLLSFEIIDNKLSTKEK